MATKADNATVEERVQRVFTMLLTGAHSFDIVQYAAQEWKIAERQAREYIARATRKLENHAKPKEQYELGLALTRLTDLYQHSVKMMDYKTALAVQKERNDLLGLKAPTRLEHTGKDGGPIETIDRTAQAAEEFDAILKRTRSARDRRPDDSGDTGS